MLSVTTLKALTIWKFAWTEINNSSVKKGQNSLELGRTWTERQFPFIRLIVFEFAW